jgi:hypothetical protein
MNNAHECWPAERSVRDKDMKAINEHQKQHESRKNIHKGNTVEPLLSGLRLTLNLINRTTLL